VTAGRIHLFPVAEVTTRMSLLIVFAGFFEGFGHGLMGKSGFGYSEIALGGFTAFGRDFARKGEATGMAKPNMTTRHLRSELRDTGPRFSCLRRNALMSATVKSAIFPLI
jgi:hypothetical protein